MTGELRAIETVYHGYRFRSRLEARWAVFFDTLGVPFEYEKEGFDLGGVLYLPDFWLPEQQCWIEIKGTHPSVSERLKCAMLAEQSGHEVFLFPGSDFQPHRWSEDRDFEGMGATVFWPERYDDEGDYGFCWGTCKICAEVPQYPRTTSCIAGSRHADLHLSKAHNHNGDFGNHLAAFDYRSPSLISAYTIARQARFEHGERGAPATHPRVNWMQRAREIEAERNGG